MKTAHLIAASLARKLTLGMVSLFSFSTLSIGLIITLSTPFYLLSKIRTWHLIIRYLKMTVPTRKIFSALICYHYAQVDRIIWTIIVYNAWDEAEKFNDFSAIDDLKTIIDRGKGLLLFGMHYGPMMAAYALYRKGLNPAILKAQIEIQDLESFPYRWLLTEEYLFRSAYSGVAQSKHSEKYFIKMMLDGKPGFMMIDVFPGEKRNFINFLGNTYPIGTFPFKLALTHNFPTAVIWFTKIKGAGYKLNVIEIFFNTIEVGVTQYGNLLNQTVSSNPCFWNYAAHYASQQFIS